MKSRHNTQQSNIAFVLTVLLLPLSIMSSDSNSSDFASHGCVNPYEIMERAEHNITAEFTLVNLFCNRTRAACLDPVQQFSQLAAQKQNDPKVAGSIRPYNDDHSPLQNYQTYLAQAEAIDNTNILDTDTDKLSTLYVKAQNNLDVLYKIHSCNLEALSKSIPLRFITMRKEFNLPHNAPNGPDGYKFIEVISLLYAPINRSLPIHISAIGLFDVHKKKPISCSLFPNHVKTAIEKYIQNQYNCALLVLEMFKDDANAQQTKQ